MLEVEKWSEDKPYLIKLFAPRLATEAQEIHKAFEQIKDRRILNHQLATPDPSCWLAQYRSHRNTFEVLLKIITAEYGEKIAQRGYFVYRALISFRSVRKINQTHRRPFSPRIQNIIIKSLNSLLPIIFKALKLDLTGAPINPATKKAIIDQISNDVETSFFILVTAPCWILYHTAPLHLYRNACRGNVDAIEKLLRLDSFLIHDPSIIRRIQEHHLNHNSVMFESLLTAPLKSPNILISRKHIKIEIAGLISALSHLIKQPLSEPQIRQLFDAVAKDSVPNNAKLHTIDTEIPDGQQSFSKAIQRSRKAWLNMFFKPDKN